MGNCCSSEHGYTALMIAAKNGHTDAVNALLAHNANVEAKNRADWTALMLAAIYGHVDIVDALLAHNASVDAKSNYGQTSLMLAAKYGHTAVDALLAHNANMELKNCDGETALMRAAMYGQTDIVEALLAHNANVDATDRAGRTALMLAALKGHVVIVNALLAHNANMVVKDWNGFTALGIAVSRRHGDYIPCVSALLREGASIDMTASYQLEGLLRCSVESEDVYGLLKARLENEDVLDGFIQFTCRRGTDDFTSLLNMGVLSFDREDKDGDTPLTLAAANSNSELVEFLLDRGADAEHENLFGESALSFAVSNRKTQMQELLTSRGAVAKDKRPDNYPKWGMTLADFDEFISKIGKENLKDKNAYDLKKHVLDLTADEKLSYCERFGKTHKANVFVSHAWKFKFTEVRGALEAYLITNKKSRDTVFWFDLFSVNQHLAGSTILPFSFWCTTFKGAIFEISEIYAAVSTGCRFSVTLTNEDRAELRAELRSNPRFIEDLVKKIDITKCEAQDPTDLRLILKSIQKYQGGAAVINEKLRSCVKEGYEAAAHAD